VTRIVFILGGGLLVMLATVAFRAEATRLQYRQVQVERDILAARQVLREKELELARLRNPAMIQRRVLEHYFDTQADDDTLDPSR
jgi:hypothetical protein